MQCSARLQALLLLVQLPRHQAGVEAIADEQVF
jgi:hypothetical protein